MFPRLFQLTPENKNDSGAGVISFPV